MKSVEQLKQEAVIEHGKTLNLSEVNLAKKVDITNTPYEHFGRVGRVDNAYETVLPQMGMIGTNNGRAMWVDENGRTWLGRNDHETLAALREAGYRSGGLWVMFSNGEQALDPTVKLGMGILRHGLDSEVNGYELQVAETTLATARKKGVTPMSHAEKAQFLKLDGLMVQHLGSDPQLVQGVVQGRLRHDDIGHYNTNNGTVCFVDDQGSIMVANATQERLQTLQAHGYTRSGMHVDMSNGERVVGFPSARWSSGIDPHYADLYLPLDEAAKAHIEATIGQTSHFEPILRDQSASQRGFDEEASPSLRRQPTMV